jgi:predicted PurR-regulated permease PerM
MTSPVPTSEGEQFRRVIDITIRVGVVALLGYLCFSILVPFLIPTMWGILLAVAVSPLHARITRMFHGRAKLAAVLLTIIALAALLLPALMASISIVENGAELVRSIENGTFVFPPPPEAVRDWPVVGPTVHEAWSLAATNLEAAVSRYGAQLADLGLRALGSVGSTVFQILLFALSTIIAGILLATAHRGSELARAVARRLADERGDELVDLCSSTIQSVTKGVLGVALVQTILCWLGLIVAGIPGSGIFGLLILVIAIVQLPPLLILSLPIVWAFAHMDTLPAVLFTVWSVLASSSDGLLKPLLLGRGLTTPMLVILIGAIGGMLFAGIIGLFVGAVVLALGYELFLAWLTPPRTDLDTSPLHDGF